MRLRFSRARWASGRAGSISRRDCASTAVPLPNPARLVRLGLLPTAPRKASNTNAKQFRGVGILLSAQGRQVRPSPYPAPARVFERFRTLDLAGLFANCP